MKLFILDKLISCAVVCVFAYRDGARENSCYDHSIEHGAGIETFPCDPLPARDPCPFFLRIREVVNQTTLELGNETDAYQCGRIYGSKLIILLMVKVGTSNESDPLNPVSVCIHSYVFNSIFTILCSASLTYTINCMFALYNAIL